MPGREEKHQSNLTLLSAYLPVLQGTNFSCSALQNNKKMCFFCLSCFRSSFSFPLLFSLLYICCHYILYHFFHILLFKYLICFPCDTKLFGHISLNILHLVSCVIGLTFCCFLHFLFPALFCCSIVYCLCLLCLLYFTNFTCSSVQTYTSNEKKKIPFLDWDHTCL